MRREAYQTIRLALPIIIGELAQMALHIIDTAMVGAISYKQLAAVALVVNVLNIPFVLGIGMTISVSQMVSMAHGPTAGKSYDCLLPAARRRCLLRCPLPTALPHASFLYTVADNVHDQRHD